MTEPNEHAMEIARAIVADQNHPAHRKDIMAKKWDSWGAVQAAYHQVLKGPQMIIEGSE